MEEMYWPGFYSHTKKLEALKNRAESLKLKVELDEEGYFKIFYDPEIVWAFDTFELTQAFIDGYGFAVDRK